MIGIWMLLLAIVALTVGLLNRWRIRRVRAGHEPVVTDELLRRVLEEGSVEVESDEPLDEEQIRRAEDEFWSSEWDEAEPWGG